MCEIWIWTFLFFNVTYSTLLVPFMISVEKSMEIRHHSLLLQIAINKVIYIWIKHHNLYVFKNTIFQTCHIDKWLNNCIRRVLVRMENTLLSQNCWFDFTKGDKLRKENSPNGWPIAVLTMSGIYVYYVSLLVIRWRYWFLSVITLSIICLLCYKI